MADKITNTKTLYIGLTDSQNKLELLKLPNPKNELEDSDIKTATRYLVSTIGIYDKYGEQFSESSITTAYTEAVKKIELDIR